MGSLIKGKIAHFTATAVVVSTAIIGYANAATPSSCSIGSLAGKWILYTSIAKYNFGTECSVTVGTDGFFSGKKSCTDYGGGGFSSVAYSVTGSFGREDKKGVNSCAVMLLVEYSVGGEKIKGVAKATISAGKDQISGIFGLDTFGTGAEYLTGPISLIKVP